MSGLVLTNNARSTLAAAVATGDASISLAAGDGAKFPVIGSGQWHPLTLLHADGTFEIVKVTARATDTLTVTRGQEGTTAQAFNAGDMVELRLTTAAMNDLINGVATLQSGKLDQNNKVKNTSAYHYRDVAALDSNTTGQTGTLKITLPVAWTNTMLKMRIEGYDYQTGESWTVVVGGYNYSGGPGWYNGYAWTDNTAKIGSVRLAFDGTNVCVLIGNTGSTWNYPQIVITDVIAGYGGEAGLSGTWSIGFLASETGITNILAVSLNNGQDAATLGGNAPSYFAAASSVPTKVSQLTNDSNYITAGGAPVQSVAGKTGAVTLANTDISGFGTASTHAATDFLAYNAQAVDSAKLGGQLPSYYAAASSVPGASSTAPVMDGTAAVGTGTTWARADHVHPSDTSRLAATAQAVDSAKWNGANKTVSTAAPSGGANGDVWFQYS